MKQWRFYPIYGLILTDDDGLADPIFTDATFVTQEFVAKLAKDMAGSGAQYLSGEPFGPSFAADSEAFSAAPKAYLFEQAPHSWIAVKRLKEEDGREYAQRIASFLTACMVLRGKHAMSFPMRPDVLAWSIGPEAVHTNEAGQLTALKKITANNHVVMNPIVVRKSALRASYHSGTSLTFRKSSKSPESTWDINKSMPIAAVCLGRPSKDATKNVEHLSAAALHLVNACCAKEVASQIQMAVSALELIFGTNEFTKLRQIAFTFIKRADERAKIEELLEARHRFVHRGTLNSETATRIAADGILLAYLFLDVFCGFAAATSRYREKVAICVEGNLLADRLEALDPSKRSQADEIRKNTSMDALPLLSSQVLTASTNER